MNFIFKTLMVCNHFDPQAFVNGAAWKNRNRITFSALQQFEVAAYDAPTYSIKYVLSGTEHYVLNNKKIPVVAGKFLVVNKEQPLDFIIRSKSKVLGLCIHLEERFLIEVYTSLHTDEAQLLERPTENRPMPELDELVYSDKENELGAYLRQIASRFDQHTTAVNMEEEELFYRLAEKLAGLQNRLSRAGRGLQVLKNSTREELLKRLAIAKEIMDSDRDGGDMSDIAKKAMLSGSHFFRSFKKVYGISPHQYILQRRMIQASQLLKDKKMNATEVAFSCGYPDLPSFSKAFKKIFHQSPGQFSKQAS